MARRKNRRRSRRNPGPLGWAAIAAGVAAAGGLAYGVSRWRRAARLKPGTPSTGGDTTEPDKPSVVVPKVFMNAVFDGQQIRFATGDEYLLESDDTAVVSPGSYPIDIVFSVPASFNPIGTVFLKKNAKIVAGTPGESRDMIVRVSGPTDTVTETISFSTQYWPSGTSGYTNALKVRFE